MVPVMMRSVMAQMAFGAPRQANLLHQTQARTWLDPAMMQLNASGMIATTEISQVAVLWDMENVAPRYINGIVQDLAQKSLYPSIRLAFGDQEMKAVRKTSGANPYRDVCFRNAFRFRVTPVYVAGKNTADIEMVVAAMEICYTQPQISGIVIVSSDSDFTPLAIHLRERGKLVLGYGKENSVSSFIDACTHWTSVDIDDEDKWV